MDYHNAELDISLCAKHFIAIVSEVPNPECNYCLGTGQYLWHTENCANEHCALAAGYEDCEGEMVDCDCSILDNILRRKHDERKNSSI